MVYMELPGDDRSVPVVQFYLPYDDVYKACKFVFAIKTKREIIENSRYELVKGMRSGLDAAAGYPFEAGPGNPLARKVAEYAGLLSPKSPKSARGGKTLK